MIEINVQNEHWPCFQSLCQFRFSKHLLATSKSWTEQSWEFPEQWCPRLKTIHVCLCFQKVFYFVFKNYSCLFYVSINCFENNMIKHNFISRYHSVKRNTEKVLNFFFSHVFGKNKMLTVTGSLTKLKMNRNAWSYVISFVQIAVLLGEMKLIKSAKNILFSTFFQKLLSSEHWENSKIIIFSTFRSM